MKEIKMKKFENGMVVANKEFFADTYDKEERIACPCGKLFDPTILDADTELACETCGTLITFEPVAWEICVEKSDSLVLKEERKKNEK